MRTLLFLCTCNDWHVHDHDPSSPYDPLAEIESAVGALIVDLS